MDALVPRPRPASVRGRSLKARFRARPRQPMVSVHRGLWDPLPENSLAAIRAADRWDVIEVDVRLDRNGVPYLMHDATLERTTGAKLASDGLDLATCEHVRLKNGAGGPNAPETDEAVPTLDAAFALLDQSGAVFDLDVKRPEDIEAVASAVADLGCQDLGTLKIKVASQADVAKLVALEKRYDIMVMAKLHLGTSADLALVAALREVDVAAIEVSFTDINLLRRATSLAGDLIRFGTYTLDGVHCCGLSDSAALTNPNAVWGRLLSAGIGLIMTDQPEALSRFLMSR